MENEMWDEAIDELLRSLSIKERLLLPDDRQLAHLHYQLATAASARLQDAQQQLHGDGRPDASSVLAGAGASSAASPPADKTATPPEPPATVIARCRAQAAKHYTLAADVLSKRLERAETGSAESEDLTELLGDVRAKADEHKQADAPAGAGGLGGKATVRGEASSASVTTIGFGAPVATAAGVTTIGFGGTSGGASGSGLVFELCGAHRLYAGHVPGRSGRLLGQEAGGARAKQWLERSRSLRTGRLPSRRSRCRRCLGAAAGSKAHSSGAIRHLRTVRIERSAQGERRWPS